MRSLLLSESPVEIAYKNAKLRIRNGKETQEFNPLKLPFERILITNRHGFISLDALKFLEYHRIETVFTDYRKIITMSLSPVRDDNSNTISQVKVLLNERRRKEIATQLLDRKLESQYLFLKDLCKFHPEIGLKAPEKVQGHRLLHEAEYAEYYFSQLKTVFGQDFQRSSDYKNQHATDEKNCLLNFGYSYLERIIRQEIYMTGLSPMFSVVHEPYNDKQSLCYDLIESFRYLIEMAVYELRDIPKSWLFRTNEYQVKLSDEGIRGFISKVDEILNRSVKVVGNNQSMYVTIRRFVSAYKEAVVNGKTLPEIPHLPIARNDETEIRNRILKMTLAERKKRGIIKTEYHYLRQKALSDMPFKLYGKTKMKLQ